MRKLVQIPHGCFPSLLKAPNFLIPISHLHNPAKTQDPNSKLAFVISEAEQLQAPKAIYEFTQSVSENQNSSEIYRPSEARESMVKVSHPWPEWIDLMECLLKRGYLEADGDVFKDRNRVRTACLNFSRDRRNLIRWHSMSFCVLIWFWLFWTWLWLCVLVACTKPVWYEFNFQTRLALLLLKVASFITCLQKFFTMDYTIFWLKPSFIRKYI